MDFETKQRRVIAILRKAAEDVANEGYGELALKLEEEANSLVIQLEEIRRDNTTF